MDITVNAIVQMTINAAATICANNNKKLDKDIFASRFAESKKEWIPKIIEDAKKDAEMADIMGGLPKRIDPLVKTAFQVALTHGCTMYAKYLVEVN